MSEWKASRPPEVRLQKLVRNRSSFHLAYRIREFHVRARTQGRHGNVHGRPNAPRRVLSRPDVRPPLTRIVGAHVAAVRREDGRFLVVAVRHVTQYHRVVRRRTVETG